MADDQVQKIADIAVQHVEPSFSKDLGSLREEIQEATVSLRQSTKMLEEIASPVPEKEKTPLTITPLQFEASTSQQQQLELLKEYFDNLQKFSAEKSQEVAAIGQTTTASLEQVDLDLERYASGKGHFVDTIKLSRNIDHVHQKSEEFANSMDSIVRSNEGIDNASKIISALQTQDSAVDEKAMAKAIVHLTAAAEKITTSLQTPDQQNKGMTSNSFMEDLIEAKEQQNAISSTSLVKEQETLSSQKANLEGKLEFLNEMAEQGIGQASTSQNTEQLQQVLSEVNIQIDETTSKITTIENDNKPENKASSPNVDQTIRRSLQRVSSSKEITEARGERIASGSDHTRQVAEFKRAAYEAFLEQAVISHAVNTGEIQRPQDAVDSIISGLGAIGSSAVPIGGQAVTALTMLAREGYDQHQREKYAALADATPINRLVETADEFASKLAYQYQHQVAMVDSEDLPKLAKFATEKILSNAKDLDPAEPVTEQLSTIVAKQQETVMSMPGGDYLPTEGLGLNVRLRSKGADAPKNMTADGLFTRSGIRAEDGSSYTAKDSNVAKYGLRYASNSEVSHAIETGRIGQMDFSIQEPTYSLKEADTRSIALEPEPSTIDIDKTLENIKNFKPTPEAEIGIGESQPSALKGIKKAAIGAGKTVIGKATDQLREMAVSEVDGVVGNLDGMAGQIKDTAISAMDSALETATDTAKDRVQSEISNNPTAQFKKTLMENDLKAIVVIRLEDEGFKAPESWKDYVQQQDVEAMLQMPTRQGAMAAKGVTTEQLAQSIVSTNEVETPSKKQEIIRAASDSSLERAGNTPFSELGTSKNIGAALEGAPNGTAKSPATASQEPKTTTDPNRPQAVTLNTAASQQEQLGELLKHFNGLKKQADQQATSLQNESRDLIGVIEDIDPSIDRGRLLRTTKRVEEKGSSLSLSAEVVTSSNTSIDIAIKTIKDLQERPDADAEKTQKRTAKALEYLSESATTISDSLENPTNTQSKAASLAVRDKLQLAKDQKDAIYIEPLTRSRKSLSAQKEKLEGKLEIAGELKQDISRQLEAQDTKIKQLEVKFSAIVGVEERKALLLEKGQLENKQQENRAAQEQVAKELEAQLQKIDKQEETKSAAEKTRDNIKKTPITDVFRKIVGRETNASKRNKAEIVVQDADLELNTSKEEKKQMDNKEISLKQEEGALDKSLQTVGEKIGVLTDQISTEGKLIEGELLAAKAEKKKLESQQSTLNQKIGDMTKEVQGVDGQIAGVNDKINAVENSQLEGSVPTSELAGTTKELTKSLEKTASFRKESNDLEAQDHSNTENTKQVAAFKRALYQEFDVQMKVAHGISTGKVTHTGGATIEGAVAGAGASADFLVGGIAGTIVSTVGTAAASAYNKVGVDKYTALAQAVPLENAHNMAEELSSKLAYQYQDQIAMVHPDEISKLAKVATEKIFDGARSLDTTKEVTVDHLAHLVSKEGSGRNTSIKAKDASLPQNMKARSLLEHTGIRTEEDIFYSHKRDDKSNGQDAKYGFRRVTEEEAKQAIKSGHYNPEGMEKSSKSGISEDVINAIQVTPERSNLDVNKALDSIAAFKKEGATVGIGESGTFTIDKEARQFKVKNMENDLKKIVVDRLKADGFPLNSRDEKNYKSYATTDDFKEMLEMPDRKIAMNKKGVSTEQLIESSVHDRDAIKAMNKQTKEASRDPQAIPVAKLNNVLDQLKSNGIRLGGEHSDFTRKKMAEDLEIITTKRMDTPGNWRENVRPEDVQKMLQSRISHEIADGLVHATVVEPFNLDLPASKADPVLSKGQLKETLDNIKTIGEAAGGRSLTDKPFVHKNMSQNLAEIVTERAKSEDIILNKRDADAWKEHVNAADIEKMLANKSRSKFLQSPSVKAEISAVMDKISPQEEVSSPTQPAPESKKGWDGVDRRNDKNKPLRAMAERFPPDGKETLRATVKQSSTANVGNTGGATQITAQQTAVSAEHAAEAAANKKQTK